MNRSIATWILILGILLTIYGYFPYLALQNQINQTNSQPGGCLGTVDGCVEIGFMYQNNFPYYESMMIVGPIVLLAGAVMFVKSRPEKTQRKAGRSGRKGK